MQKVANGELTDWEQSAPTREARRILDTLLAKSERLKLPKALAHDLAPNFTSDYEEFYFPTPFKETETTAALKALEAGVVAELAKIRYGNSFNGQISIQIEKVACYLFATYLATIDGHGKHDPKAKLKLKDTDLLHAQSVPYRRMSANLYQTKEPGRYYHIHGSLEATKTLNMIGLPAERPDLTTMSDIIKVIESHVEQFTVAELEKMNAENRQAGVECLTHEEFVASPHGQAYKNSPPWELDAIETTTPPVAFPKPRTWDERRVLNGIRVLELCRIIAGPAIGKILAEYGADVLKVTSPHLSDVPFFQVDGNMSKHTADIDLTTREGREIFDKLLLDADIVLDGYRPGALERLGYGPKAIAELGKKRGKGYVYINENCFGYHGPWADRPGWQQIADCASGVAWAQGRFLGLGAPLVPPFPMSDYGTGCMGAIAALTGLFHRATTGGSWHGKVSLLQYDLLLFEVGPQPSNVQICMMKNFGWAMNSLRYHDSVDTVSGTVLGLIKSVHPYLVDPRYQEKWYSEKFDAEVQVVKPAVEIVGLDIGYVRATRPNGSDLPTWDFGVGKDKKLS